MGVLTIGVSSLQGVLITGVSSLQGLGKEEVQCGIEYCWGGGGGWVKGQQS